MYEEFNFVEPDERLEAQRMHLRQLKDEEGFEWAHLAEIAEVSSTSVSQWVTNSTDKLKAIRRKNAERISKEYPHCPVEWIMGEVHWRNDREMAAFALLHAYGENREKRAMFDLLARFAGWHVVEPDRGRAARISPMDLDKLTDDEIADCLEDIHSRYVALVRDGIRKELSLNQYKDFMSKLLEIFNLELKYMHTESEDR